MNEKTEKATPKRLRQAREQGEVARSTEFSGAVVMTGVVAVLIATSTSLVAYLAQFIRQSIEHAFSPNPNIGELLIEGATTFALVIGPILVVATVVALIVSYLQVGPGFSMKVIVPSAKRINPAAGLVQLTSPERMFDVAKTVAKFVFVTAAALVVLWHSSRAVISLIEPPFEEAFGEIGSVLLQAAGAMVAVLLITSLVDLIWQRHVFAKKMRMSKQEVRDEQRESEGDPFMKAQRAVLHRALGRESGVRNVKNADVVVCHDGVAVAIRYDPETRLAPLVIASGVGAIGTRILTEANRTAVPIVAHPSAQSLADVEISTPVPHSLFDDVADILRSVYLSQSV